MHPELLSLCLFMFVRSCSPGPNNIVASHSGFNHGFNKTIPLMLGVIFGFTFMLAVVNFGLIKIINFSEMFKRAKDIFKDLKSETLPDEEVKMMSGGQRQAVAIGRTKLSKAKVVLLDEPTAAISVRQVAEVLELIKQLKNQGIAVVIISHRMPDVFAVSDRIAVLRRGQLVANKLAKESSPEEVTALITGAIEKA